MATTVIDHRKTGEIISADDLPGDLLTFAAESNVVSEKQVSLFADLWERHHDAPPADATRDAFRSLGRRKATAYIDVLLGRTKLDTAS